MPPQLTSVLRSPKKAAPIVARSFSKNKRPAGMTAHNLDNMNHLVFTNGPVCGTLYAYCFLNTVPSQDVQRSLLWV